MNLQLIPGGLPLLASEVQEHMKKQGLRAYSNLSGDIPIDFIEVLVALHSEYKEITITTFSNDSLLSIALNKALASVVNYRQNPKQPCKSPELLAKYCDSLLKKSTKGGSDSEVDEKLAQCITVFKYIDDKDVFQKFYARMLAKRLIHQQSHSMDSEEAMINRLKQACGYEFTNKLHRMFTDMSVSSDLNIKFSQHLQNKDKIELGLNFSIYVLQAGAWPLGQSCPTDFAVPRELERSVQRFEGFYRDQFSNRKLSWLHHLANGELKLNYLKKPYIITMQTFQMAILLMFEGSDSMSCKELMEATKLNSEHFQKYVQSLVESKLLSIAPSTAAADVTSASTSSASPTTADAAVTFEPHTMISLNLDYSNKRTKFRITAAVQKETVQETEQTHSSVDEDRKLYLQVC